MKKFQSIIAVFLIMALLPIAGCSLFGGPKDANPEAIVPQDVTGIFVIDHSNMDQVKNFVALWDKIPTLGFTEGFKDGFTAEMSGIAKTIFEDPNNKAIIDGSWKIVVGAKVPSDPAKFAAMMEKEDITMGSGGLEIYVGAKFGEADKVQEVLNKLTQDPKEELKFIGDEKNPVWEFPQGEGKMMIVRYGSLYFLAASDAERKAIIDRIEKEEGFDRSEKFAKNMKLLGEDNLGYAFVDAGQFMTLYKGMIASTDVEIPVEMLGLFRDVWAVLSADEDGIKFASKTYLGGEQSVIDKYYPAYQLSLAKKVSGKGVISYVEQPSVGLYLDSFAKGFASGFNSVQQEQLEDDLGVDIESAIVEPEPVVVEPVVDEKKVSRTSGYKSTVAPVNTPLPQEEIVTTEPAPEEESLSGTVQKIMDDPYDMVLSELATVSGLTKDDLKKIFDNPYAFVISNPGEYVPAIAFYLQLDSTDVENAKKLVSSLATYADQVIAEMNKFLASSGMEGLVQKEVKIVEGAAIQRIFVDWTKMPTAQMEELNITTGLNIALIKVELYYGVMADGTFVFAFYPDFTNDYGKETIADSTYYKEAVSRAGGISGRSIVFVRTEPLLALANKYMALAQKAGLIEPDMISMAQIYMTIASSFNSVFNTDVKDEDGLRQHIYLKIDKVEFSPEMQEQMNAITEASKNAAEAQQKFMDETLKQSEELDGLGDGDAELTE